MAITSKGYEGSVDYADWAGFTAHMGGTYSVFGGAGAFSLSAGPGDRQVVVAPGTAAGAGILDASDSAVTLAGGVVASGSRWDMVVLHREWGSTNATSLELVQGGPTKVLPSRDIGPGAADDQPLWLVRFTAGQSTVQEMVDLRVWRGDGGLVANDVLARSYVNRVGTVMRIGASRWERVLTGGVAVWTDFTTTSYAHSEVAAATWDGVNNPNVLARYSSGGRLAVAAPTVGTQAANKDYVDGVGAISSIENTIMRRNTTGQSFVAPPTLFNGVVNKGYCDANQTTNASSLTSGTLSRPVNTNGDVWARDLIASRDLHADRYVHGDAGISTNQAPTSSSSGATGVVYTSDGFLRPATSAATRATIGITSGTAAPSGGANGDIYFRIVD